MLRHGKGFVICSACLMTLAGPPASAVASPTAGKPAYLWLWYADGKEIPEDGPYCTNLGDPPAYKCNFGTDLKDCQKQVQAYLDGWYKDFNLVFSLTRPLGNEYNTVAITSGWPKCASEAADLTGGTAGNEGGIAPGICAYATGQTAVAIACGSNALDCATIIAHEHGHTVGLVHTTDPTDVMYPTVHGEAKGFVNQDMKTVLDFQNACGPATQNSYGTMLQNLGEWPGGAKPGLAFPLPDGGVADAAGDAISADAAPDAPPDTGDGPASGTVIGPPQGPAIDGNVTVLPGFDAISRPPPVIPDAPPGTPIPQPSSGDGCSMAHSPDLPSLFFTAFGLALCLIALWRRSGSRDTVRAGSATARRP